MELVIYGCGGEVHNPETGCEFFEVCLNSKEESLAFGFDVKQPPICEYCHDMLTNIVKSNTNIKKLTLAFMTNMPRVFMNGLYESIIQSQSILSINIRWADVGLLDDRMTDFLSQLRNTEINLKFDAVRMDDEKGEKIIKQLGNNANLENFYLSMNGNMISNKSLVQLDKVFQNSGKKMKNVLLSLRSNEINDNNSLHIGSSLKQLGDNTQSLSLTFDECLFDSEGISNITNFLPTQLSKFQFSYDDNMIGDEQLKQFSANMKFNPIKLQELDLNFSQNEFGDEGIAYLSLKIAEFISLKSLSLNFRRNSISDEGLEHLFNNLTKLTSLESLSLNISGFYDEIELKGIDRLLENLKCLKKLVINMQDNKIKSQGIQKLSSGIKCNKNIFDLCLNFFYGEVDQIDPLLITIIDEILNHKRNFGELSIITDRNSPNTSSQQLLSLLNEICLKIFEQTIQLILIQKQQFTSNISYLFHSELINLY